MSRPPALARAVWADWARVTISLGLVDAWTPSGGEWDGATWDESVWGESYLTPNQWLDVTADTMALDIDTGRNGADDPGDIAAVTLDLFDPAGDYAIAGSGRYAVGNLVKVETEWVAGGVWRATFTGVVTDASAHGDLAAPSTSLKVTDLLGALMSTDDAEPLPAQTVTERIAELLDRASVPPELRDLADDSTALLAVDKAGNRLDAARGAAECSVGGTILAMGDGRIRYRYGAFMYEPSRPVALKIGTVAGAVCPTVLDLAEAGDDVKNIYDWANNDRDTPLRATASDKASIKRFGRRSSVRTDLLNADLDQLRALVEEELIRTAWAPERVDSCSITVAGDESAAAVTLEVGDLLEFTYSGSAPWESSQLLGGYAHHITPDEWTIDIRAYPAVIANRWDEAMWDSDTWSLGAMPSSTREAVPA